MRAEKSCPVEALQPSLSQLEFTQHHGSSFLVLQYKWEKMTWSFHFPYHGMDWVGRDFKYVVRWLHLSFPICTSSQWRPTLAWYLQTQTEEQHLLPFLQHLCFLGSSQLCNDNSAYSLQNRTGPLARTLWLETTKHSHQIIALSVKQQVFLTVWVGLAADSLAVALLDWHSFQSFCLLGHPL